MLTQTANRGAMYEFAITAYNDFIANTLPVALAEIKEPARRIYYFKHLMPDGLYTRRLLLVGEPKDQKVSVQIEASYEFFEGDTHYYVRRVGTVTRAEAAEKLLTLLPEAFEQLMAWHSSHENIWEERAKAM